jgi:hypothetical protein
MGQWIQIRIPNLNVDPKDGRKLFTYLQGEEDISCFEKQGFRSIPEFLEASFFELESP